MRLDDATGRSTIDAALRAGIVVFDTARAYGNEHLLVGVRGRILTKCGMKRPEGAWVPDGRAIAILEDARASAELLGAIDTLLLHAPDPRTPLETSVRALARARDEGLAKRIGVCNVTRTQLLEAERVTRIDAVQVALGAAHDAPMRGGLVRHCLERGIEVFAHSPLGGPKKAARVAREHDVEELLSFLVSLGVIPLVGTRRVDMLARAGSRALADDARTRLLARFPGLSPEPVRAATEGSREVVMHMGIAGAGKSTAASPERLNRDLRGGTLKGIARALDERLSAGAERVVLDNTYLTRASRQEVVATAARHGARVRCVFHDTPLHEAQHNVVLRMLGKYGRLLEPEELIAFAKTDANLIRPSVLFRMVRELEPPSLDEGFTEIERVPFARREQHERGATFVAAERAGEVAIPEGPTLVFGWNVPEPATTAEVAICHHPAGPPVCWCRPPLPGLLVAFAEKHAIDLRKSVLHPASAAHEQMARALGISLVA